MLERNFQLSDFRRVVEINDLTVIKQLVEQNCGITFYTAVLWNGSWRKDSCARSFAGLGGAARIYLSVEKGQCF